MAELAHFSLLAITAAIMIAVGLAVDNPDSAFLGIGCSPHKYVNTTAFTENLESVLRSLLSSVSSFGFATSMQNNPSKTDPVYGLAVCRKYLTARECSECVQEAAKQAARLAEADCSKPNGIRIHLDGCFLRYENNSFYDQDDYGNYVYCGSANARDPGKFSQTVQALSTQLITNASANNGYAVGSTDGSLYGLAQCWTSITGSCETCLTTSQYRLLTCPPRIEGRGLEAGCFMRYSTYSFFSASKNLTPSSGKTSSHIVPILVGSIGAVALAALLCLACFYRKNCNRADENWADENLVARGNFEQAVFDYEILKDSTGNFDRNNMVGKGGFGEVYKGILPDGRIVAVKKLIARHETIAAEEFLREVSLLSSVRHRNLVRLVGCCTQGHERLLVYEFMSNGSLNMHVFGETRSALSWESRLNIIVGTARGLAYLHEDSNDRIIHRDIKCGNILLDDRFHPKIADFGLARFFPEEQETYVSTGIGGTLGYTAPEYAVHGQLTEKADIYSYGIVVLEIVSGRKCVDGRLPDPMQILVQWGWNQYANNQVLDIVDPTLEQKYPREQALRVIKTALLCTQGSWGLRPAMSQVVWMLTNNLEIPVQPTKPAFIDTLSGRPAEPSPTSNFGTSASAASLESHGSFTASFTPR